MAFSEGRVLWAKEFNGNAFPKTLFPAEGSGREGLAERVRAERERLGEDLRRHGALLLRGFDVKSAEDFSQVVAAFGWEEFVYVGAASRDKLADRVLTVNKEPLDVFLNFHHEMALTKEHPNKIFFCCLEPSPEGGETSIILSNFIVEKLEEKIPESMRKMENDGIITVMNTNAWQRILGTQDKTEAEKRAMNNYTCSSVKINDDGSADFTYGPMSPVKMIDGKRVMWYVYIDFNMAERIWKTTYGDGSSLPEEASRAYYETIDEGCVDVKWEKGDVLCWIISWFNTPGALESLPGLCWYLSLARFGHA